MPCHVELASGLELENGWVTEFLKELNGDTPSYSQVDYDYWGKGSKNLTTNTILLCSKLTAMSEDSVVKLSPQLRYWWKRHQMHDQLRAYREEIGLTGSYPEGF